MRRFVALVALTTVTTLALAASPASADAQSFGDRLKKKAEEAAKRKAEERTEKRAGQAADKALDKVECAASDKACQEKAAAQSGANVTTSGGDAVPRGRVGEGAWVNYDFKPGDRALFIDDFTRDEVGDFPRRLELIGGNMEVAEWDGRRFLRGTTDPSTFEIKLKDPLPDRFTLEADVKLGQLNGATYWILFGGEKNRTYFGGNHVVMLIGHGGDQTRPGSVSAGLMKGNDSRIVTEVTSPGALAGQIFPLRVMADGKYVKVYVGSTRVANVPNADLGRTNTIRFQLTCNPEEPCFVGNIRIMAGGKKLYDALAESGRVSTQGIYFDTGSDRIRPESTPTLKEIGQMLKENPDLKITIEGHTDNAGDGKANEELSNRRAAAVKAYLVEKHGVDASRLGSAGIGAKKPVAKNDSPEGRQQNRRVELVKM